MERPNRNEHGAGAGQPDGRCLWAGAVHQCFGGGGVPTVAENRPDRLRRFRGRYRAAGAVGGLQCDDAVRRGAVVERAVDAVRSGDDGLPGGGAAPEGDGGCRCPVAAAAELAGGPAQYGVAVVAGRCGRQGVHGAGSAGGDAGGHAGRFQKL